MPTVLVVEDNTDLRELFVNVLCGEGYRAHGAKDGQEALEILKTADPCVVLLDMMMPNVDGLMFLGALRGMHRLATLPIIVVSAIGEKGVPGAAAFVKKPVAPHVLVALVREYCGSP